MSEVQRHALARDIAMRLISAPRDHVRILDRLAVRLDQLRSLSWTRRKATGPGDEDSKFHLVSLSGGSFVTRCNGRWYAGDTVETSLDGPPLHQLCGACVERWARARGLELYGLLELARDLATEDTARADLHEAARLAMIGGAE